MPSPRFTTLLDLPVALHGGNVYVSNATAELLLGSVSLPRPRGTLAWARSSDLRAYDLRDVVRRMPARDERREAIQAELRAVRSLPIHVARSCVGCVYRRDPRPYCAACARTDTRPRKRLS